MVWVKLDDGFPEHRKTLEAGDKAAWLFVAALCYCARNSRDGFVPAAVIPRLVHSTGAKQLASTLVETGLFETVDGGFSIHDYSEYQPPVSTERVRRYRAAHRNGKQD